MKNISYDQAMYLVKSEKALLIDVQSKEDYLKMHLPGSIHIPVQNIKGMIIKYASNKNKKIVVYCKKGVNSLAAAYMLSEIGYKNIYNIYNGIEN